MANGHGMDRVARLETFARAGYAARGIVYLLLGYFALATAGGSGADGTQGVLRQIQQMPAGTVLLILVGLGLAGWGIYRLYGAAIDIQGKGTDAKGIGTRGGHVLSGLAHLFLCYVALRLAFGDGSGGSGGGSSQAQAASTASALPMGETLIALVGVGFAIAALHQLGKAVTGGFMTLVDRDAPEFTEWLGRAGYAARAVVFAAIAWQILQVAFASGSARQASIGGALDALRETGWLYTLVAVGLALFGLFSLVMARYRRIQNENVLRRLRG